MKFFALFLDLHFLNYSQNDTNLENATYSICENKNSRQIFKSKFGGQKS